MTFDLEAVVREREPFTFTFGGETYTLPPDMSLSVLANLRTRQDVAALEELLGEEQWTRIVASPAIFGVMTANALVMEYAKHIGFDGLGGSSASTAR